MVCSLFMGFLRMRKHSPECGDRVTARAQTCLPSIALATEGLRTPCTAFAVVIEFKIILISIFVIRMFVCSIFFKNFVPLCLCAYSSELRPFLPRRMTGVAA